MLVMRGLGCALAVCAALPASANAEGAGMRVHAAGPAVVGETVSIVVEARADGARLTFPDLQGELGVSACSLNGTPGRRRFQLPYRPRWPGRHVVTVTVTTGGCGGRRTVTWRPLVIDVEPAGQADAAGARPGRTPCRGAGRAPVPRRVRAARLGLVCLLNAERAARGLPAVHWRPALRRAASRKAHRLRRRARQGEHLLVATGEQASPARVLGAWLGADTHRADLLDPRIRSVGAAVVAGPRGPLRRLGATWVLELG